MWYWMQFEIEVIMLQMCCYEQAVIYSLQLTNVRSRRTNIHFLKQMLVQCRLYYFLKACKVDLKSLLAQIWMPTTWGLIFAISLQMMHSNVVAFRYSTCVSCRLPLTSRFIMVTSKTNEKCGIGEFESDEQKGVNPTHFHPQCLVCSRCGLQLNENHGRCWTNHMHGILCPMCHKMYV